MLRDPVVVALYWGAYFDLQPSVRDAFDQFFTDICASTYFNKLSQYGVSAPTFRGSFVVHGAIHPNSGGIEQQLQFWLSRNLIPVPETATDAKSWVYVVIPPPGEIVFDNGDETDVNICGYHNHAILHYTGYGFGNLKANGSVFWLGDFSGTGESDVLFYHPGDGNWWIGDPSTGKLAWTQASDTRDPNGTNYGDTSKYPTWIGDYQGVGHDQVVMYSHNDGHWLLGDFAAPTQWQVISNTRDPNGTNYGDTSKYPTWIGDYQGVGHDQVVMYSHNDGHWLLGDFTASPQWQVISNTRDPNGTNYGDTSKYPTWIGDYQGVGHDQVLMYSHNDGHWLLGDFTASPQWQVISNTRDPNGTNYGDTSKYPTWIGDYKGVGYDQVLMYSHNDGHWLLGDFPAAPKQWQVASNTRDPNGYNFGDTSKDPAWIGNFTGTAQSQVMLYAPSENLWRLGTYDAGTMTMGWLTVGNTATFGNLDDKRPIWAGKFTSATQDSMLFYYPTDGNWWLGTVNAKNALAWELAGNTGITVNYKADTAWAIVGLPEPGPNAVAFDIVNGITFCLSHEMAEAFTNPRLNDGWFASNGCEISDICEASGNVQVGQWTVETYWSNDDKSCVS